MPIQWPEDVDSECTDWRFEVSLTANSTKWKPEKRPEMICQLEDRKLITEVGLTHAYYKKFPNPAALLMLSILPN